MIEQLVGTYSPTDESLNMEAVKEHLLALQDSGKFDTQFNSVPNAVKSVKRRKYPLTSSIDLCVKEGLRDFSNSIKSVKEANGERFIKVLCENEETYRLFIEE